MSGSGQPTVEAELCGKWMPRAKTTCARTPGHAPPCMTPASMERNRKYDRDGRTAGICESPELQEAQPEVPDHQLRNHRGRLRPDSADAGQRLRQAPRAV